MTVVMTLVVRDEADIVDAQIAYHLNAGVDFVIASDHESRDGTTEILESYARDGYLHRIPVQGEVRESAWRTHMARLAATDFSADWVINTDADEFWWPRGESLNDVLVVIPPRYGVVQALVRVFPPRPGDGPFATRMTARPSLLVPAEEWQEPLEWGLRPVYRVDPTIDADSGDGILGGRRVPLRAWYPIEVLRFPLRSLERSERVLARMSEPRCRIEAEALEAYREGVLGERFAELVLDDERLARGLADGLLVVDVRLRDALHVLQEGAEPERRFALPWDGESRLELRAPSIVDDASYAVECAAVGEVDLVGLDQHIRELEQRISLLEARFWPRVVRRLARLGRRRR